MLKTKSDSIAAYVPARKGQYKSWFLSKKGVPFSFSKQNAWKLSQQLQPAYELDGSLYAIK